MTGMRQRDAHALLAALLRDPNYLNDSWNDRRHAIVLQLSCYPFGEENLKRIQQFSGHIAKVRHNQLYDIIPLTMQALHVAGLEIDFFTYYSTEFNNLWETQRPLPLPDRRRAFVSSLIRYLNGRPRTSLHLFLLDVISHEECLISVRSTINFDELNAFVSPVFRGRICSTLLRWHPQQLEQMVDQGRPPPPADHASTCYIYVRQKNACHVSLYQVDELTNFLLSFVNSKTSVEGISAALSREIGQPVAARDVIRCYEAISEALGGLKLEIPCESCSLTTC